MFKADQVGPVATEPFYRVESRRPPRLSLRALGGIAAVVLLASCGGDDDAIPAMTPDQAVEFADENFSCTMRDAAGSGVEVDVRTLPNPPQLGPGQDNPNRITVGLDVVQEGKELIDTEPDTYFDDEGITIYYPTLEPEASRHGIVVDDGFGTIAYVDGQMPGDRIFEVSWTMGIGARPDASDQTYVNIPCGAGTMIVLPGAAQVIDQAPAGPDEGAFISSN
jgi:hypothetical protein